MHITDYIAISDLPEECIKECSKGGRRADPYVEKWLEKLNITFESKTARKYIKFMGIDGTDKMDDHTLNMYALWIVTGFFSDYLFDKEQDPNGDPDNYCGSDLINIACY